ncbi:Aste57867_2058 [Aphanomyces stellatus]|uniref:Aste57867_2058 protein n=1 Tax=Aphanomyces stellatus TaxID=120398 RepID=A0A485K993_9STRA|nr:hypothetical protein As57867_002054 [Aphanomyces stellatus]VFT79262.1 Aste57867_2058 [Aphanomyces stellatus]
MKHVVILVLGDVGRSPRMQYHAVSLSQLPDTKVTLVGYEGERCVPQLLAQPNIALHTFAPVRVSRSLFVLSGPLKVLIQLWQLFWILLFTLGPIDAILVQNPPTIPTLFVAWVVCKIKAAKFIIDWHNFGYTVLALSLGSSHAFVKVRRRSLIATVFERVFGQLADAHFCVTKAMQGWLKETWNIDAQVLYDKPPEFFKPATAAEQHELFTRLAADMPPNWLTKDNATLRTIKTKKGEIQMRPDRPVVLISSTSWTEDEDFGLLFQALVLLDTKIAENPAFPNVLVVVTGKGPQKEMYLKKIADMSMERVRITTLWLEAKDYPIMLGSADLGICLHTSTSGLDLPMKVLDMFGCQVPVCAVGFNCLGELVRHDKNGMVFQDSVELCEQLETLLKDFPKNEKLATLKGALKHVEHWPENWASHAAPVFQSLLAIE